ncbi:MAG: FHA domain-containing protein [Candidatus Omnitrophica bacterium]|nr:FHA domain-containing protein [Candidatus Omnitrophota bacterium]
MLGRDTVLVVYRFGDIPAQLRDISGLRIGGEDEYFLFNDKDPSKYYKLSGDPITIGRATDTGGLVLPDRQISRRHAAVSAEGRNIVIRDLGSINKTYLEVFEASEKYTSDFTSQIVSRSIEFDKGIGLREEPPFSSEPFMVSDAISGIKTIADIGRVVQDMRLAINTIEPSANAELTDDELASLVKEFRTGVIIEKNRVRRGTYYRTYNSFGETMMGGIGDATPAEYAVYLAWQKVETFEGEWASATSERQARSVFDILGVHGKSLYSGFGRDRVREEVVKDLAKMGGLAGELEAILNSMPVGLLDNPYLYGLWIQSPRVGAGRGSSFENGVINMYASLSSMPRSVYLAVFLHEFGHVIHDGLEAGYFEGYDAIKKAHMVLAKHRAFLGSEFFGGEKARIEYQAFLNEFVAELNMIYFAQGNRLREHINSMKDPEVRKAWLTAYSIFRDNVYNGREFIEHGEEYKSLEPTTGSRGVSGFDNEVYSPFIQDAINKGSFSAAVFTGMNWTANVPLRMDDNTSKSGIELDTDKWQSLDKAIALLKGEDISALKESLSLLGQTSATILFINGLDDKVSPDPSCYGSHYGLARPQFYFDSKHLDNPELLAEHLHHEIQERLAVLKGLTQPERDIVKNINQPRAPPLVVKINKIAKFAHDRLVSGAKSPIIDVRNLDQSNLQAFWNRLNVVSRDNYLKIRFMAKDMNFYSDVKSGLPETVEFNIGENLPIDALVQDGWSAKKFPFPSISHVFRESSLLPNLYRIEKDGRVRYVFTGIKTNRDLYQYMSIIKSLGYPGDKVTVKRDPSFDLMDFYKKQFEGQFTSVNHAIFSLGSLSGVYDPVKKVIVGAPFTLLNKLSRDGWVINESLSRPEYAFLDKDGKRVAVVYIDVALSDGCSFIADELHGQGVRSFTFWGTVGAYQADFELYDPVIPKKISSFYGGGEVNVPDNIRLSPRDIAKGNSTNIMDVYETFSDTYSNKSELLKNGFLVQEMELFDLLGWFALNSDSALDLYLNVSDVVDEKSGRLSGAYSSLSRQTRGDIVASKISARSSEIVERIREITPLEAGKPAQMPDERWELEVIANADLSRLEAALKGAGAEMKADVLYKIMHAQTREDMISAIGSEEKLRKVVDKLSEGERDAINAPHYVQPQGEALGDADVALITQRQAIFHKGRVETIDVGPCILISIVNADTGEQFVAHIDANTLLDEKNNSEIMDRLAGWGHKRALLAGGLKGMSGGILNNVLEFLGNAGIAPSDVRQYKLLRYRDGFMDMSSVPVRLKDGTYQARITEEVGTDRQGFKKVDHAKLMAVTPLVMLPPSKDLTRRDFLKGMVIGAIGAGAAFKAGAEKPAREPVLKPSITEKAPVVADIAVPDISVPKKSLPGIIEFLARHGINVTADIINKSVKLSNTSVYKDLARKVHAEIYQALGLAKGEAYPILFLDGFSDDSFAAAITDLGFIIVPLKNLPRDPTERLKWLGSKVPHEAVHIRNYRKDKEISPLADEAEAYKASAWSIERFEPKNTDQIRAQRMVSDAFEVLVRDREELRTEYGIDIPFDRLYYTTIDIKGSYVGIGIEEEATHLYQNVVWIDTSQGDKGKIAGINLKLEMKLSEADVAISKIVLLASVLPGIAGEGGITEPVPATQLSKEETEQIERIGVAVRSLEHGEMLNMIAVFNRVFLPLAEITLERDNMEGGNGIPIGEDVVGLMNRLRDEESGNLSDSENAMLQNLRIQRERPAEEKSPLNEYYIARLNSLLDDLSMASKGGTLDVVDIPDYQTRLAVLKDMIERLRSSLVELKGRYETQLGKKRDRIARENLMHLRNSIKASRDAADIIESRIDYAAGRAGRGMISIEDMIGLIGSQRFKSGISVNVPPASVKIRGNKVTLASALYNIVQNSSDFSYEKHKNDSRNPPHIDITGTERFDDVLGRQCAVIEISDNGGGIRNPELLETNPLTGRQKIFDINVTSREGDMTKGTGLGMTEVWYAVQDSGGRIKIENRPGEGATFKIYIPLAGKRIPSSKAMQPTPEIIPALPGFVDGPASMFFKIDEDNIVDSFENIDIGPANTQGESVIVVGQGSGAIIATDGPGKVSLVTSRVQSCTALGLSGINSKGQRVLGLVHILQRSGAKVDASHHLVIDIANRMQKQGIRDIELSILYDPSPMSGTIMPSREDLNDELKGSAKIISITTRKGSEIGPDVAVIDLMGANVSVNSMGMMITHIDRRGLKVGEPINIEWTEASVKPQSFGLPDETQMIKYTALLMRERSAIRELNGALINVIVVKDDESRLAKLKQDDSTGINTISAQETDIRGKIERRLVRGRNARVFYVDNIKAAVDMLPNLKGDTFAFVESSVAKKEATRYEALKKQVFVQDIKIEENSICSVAPLGFLLYGIKMHDILARIQKGRAGGQVPAFDDLDAESLARIILINKGLEVNQENIDSELKNLRPFIDGLLAASDPKLALLSYSGKLSVWELPKLEPKRWSEITEYFDALEKVYTAA